jgi:hypothetical protein
MKRKRDAPSPVVVAAGLTVGFWRRHAHKAELW